MLYWLSVNSYCKTERVLIVCSYDVSNKSIKQIYNPLITVALLSKHVTFGVSSPHLAAELKLDITRVALYSLCTDHAQKTWFYCCVRNIAPRTSHVIPSQYRWSVMSCTCVEVCLPSHNLETDCVTLLFHCWYVCVLLRNGWFCGLTFLAWGKYATLFSKLH
jgi:hypothetical protein